FLIRVLGRALEGGVEFVGPDALEVRLAPWCSQRRGWHGRAGRNRQGLGQRGQDLHRGTGGKSCSGNRARPKVPHDDLLCLLPVRVPAISPSLPQIIGYSGRERNAPAPGLSADQLRLRNELYTLRRKLGPDVMPCGEPHLTLRSASGSAASTSC